MAAIPVRDKWGRFACVPDPGHRELSALSLVVYELLPHHPYLNCTICDIFSMLLIGFFYQDRADGSRCPSSGHTANRPPVLYRLMKILSENYIP